MTQPHQRTRAILKTRFFLESLTRTDDTPGVSAEVRETAQQLLRYFLTDASIDELHEAAPDVLGPVEQRQPLGEPAVKAQREIPFAPLPPHLRKGTPAEADAQYRADVEAWKKRDKQK